MQLNINRMLSTFNKIDRVQIISNAKSKITMQLIQYKKESYLTRLISR